MEYVYVILLYNDIRNLFSRLYVVYAHVFVSPLSPPPGGYIQLALKCESLCDLYVMCVAPDTRARESERHGAPGAQPRGARRLSDTEVSAP